MAHSTKKILHALSAVMQHLPVAYASSQDLVEAIKIIGYFCRLFSEMHFAAENTIPALQHKTMLCGLVQSLLISNAET
jgi:hypothetical protein